MEDLQKSVERVFDLLLQKKYVLSTAESFTAGNVAAAILKISGASKIFNEGITAYSNHAKEKRLGVSEKTLKDYGAVSKETAYEMATGLFKDKETSFVITTTGIAGPNSDGTDKPVGLCYLAVGDRENLEVFKFNFSGSRKEITERAVLEAFRLAEEKLR